ncbi:MAG: hypothetical protein AAB391_03990 [Patescibacteria group bacterium]
MKTLDKEFRSVTRFGCIFIAAVLTLIAWAHFAPDDKSSQEIRLIAKSVPIYGPKVQTGTVTRVVEYHGLYQVEVWTDGDPTYRPLAFSGKPLQVGDRVTVWLTSFGRSKDGTYFCFDSPMCLQTAELIPDEDMKK